MKKRKKKKNTTITSIELKKTVAGKEGIIM